ncbi:PIN domain-containing protein [Agrobacterium vitis]|uniref:type II toxin-antitoxin system VapC family toxin n=1 Tax=Agrobacterium vitis TaxID=373 RepID=UPI000872F205|nr:type II toxin-antitoxin system VapC family toxin [Agrobacterium vitis]MCE6076989.1 PIN domain-containing protein [Agrobacterium vitis]MCF1455010.1 type II toxin-antitoxin system VapC family toxin [Agrobacterium vitis]MCF1469279.1 type II toxin-antitoxin system VapC family toxin [Agrobacterium vitis]MCM2449736.1 type II toxin-antitoxin system VapC family toxin [Agrobacterium vitis]MUO71690.1 PIN domain-containing protein [Agrobacterium vitis]
MIAIDTSVLVAIVLDEPEAESFKSVLRQEEIVIGWPTLFETRTVLTAKGFSNPADIVSRFVEAPNIMPVAFNEKHYREAEAALDRYGKGRHPASLNMGDCFSYAVSAVAKAPLLFKGRDFSQTNLKLHPASSSV